MTIYFIRNDEVFTKMKSLFFQYSFWMSLKWLERERSRAREKRNYKFRAKVSLPMSDRVNHQFSEPNFSFIIHCADTETWDSMNAARWFAIFSPCFILMKLSLVTDIHNNLLRLLVKNFRNFALKQVAHLINFSFM